MKEILNWFVFINGWVGYSLPLFTSTNSSSSFSLPLAYRGSFILICCCCCRPGSLVDSANHRTLLCGGGCYYSLSNDSFIFISLFCILSILFFNQLCLRFPLYRHNKHFTHARIHPSWSVIASNLLLHFFFNFILFYGLDSFCYFHSSEDSSGTLDASWAIMIFCWVLFSTTYVMLICP